MVEYNIDFGEKLSETARMVIAEEMETLDAQRTVLYLSLLSAEIALKAMLEHAGKSVPKIRASSHRLTQLLSDLNKCEVEIEISPGIRHYVPASRLRSCTIEYRDTQTTVGEVIDAESQGASTYPNQVRYGDVLRHFPPQVVAQMAFQITAFAREHWSTLRLNVDQ